MTRICLEVTTLQSLTRAEVGGAGQGGGTKEEKEEKEETALVSEVKVEAGAALEPTMPHLPAPQQMTAQQMMLINQQTVLTMLTNMMTLLSTHTMIRMSSLSSLCPRRH